MNILSPSILAADFSRLGEQVKEAAEAGAEYIHIDVMDGHFVPNLSMGSIVVSALRSVTDAVLDCHLMVERPMDYVEQFAKAGADSFTFHAEVMESEADALKMIQQIRDLGMRVGISVNPETEQTVITDELLKQVDMVLLMSVHPGFGGQSFIEETYDKARALKKRITENGLSTDIQVDGGITLKNLQAVLDAGVNVIVAGTSVFRGNITENVQSFCKLMNE